MSFSAFEQFDEDEYFLKFMAIHPCLYYAIDNLSIAKKNFQIILLNKIRSSAICKDDAVEIYEQIIDLETQNKILLNRIKYEQDKILLSIKETNDELLVNYIENLI